MFWIIFTALAGLFAGYLLGKHNTIAKIEAQAKSAEAAVVLFWTKVKTKL